jgi:hypothetical protein
VQPPQPALGVLLVTRLDRLFPLYPDRGSARAALAQCCARPVPLSGAPRRTAQCAGPSHKPEAESAPQGSPAEQVQSLFTSASHGANILRLSCVRHE